MALRTIVKIDREKCNGCGLCVAACAEGAIEIAGGKARLVSETYCDGLGACLGHCPQGAITVERREAAAFDEAAVQARPAGRNGLRTGHEQQLPSLKPGPDGAGPPGSGGFVCPGTMMRQLDRLGQETPGARPEAGEQTASELSHWPVQLMLVSPSAPYFQGADLLLAADCVPFAMADFHQRLLKGRTVAVGCPKLDDAAYYVKKLAELLQASRPRRLTVAHMQVPCCFGLTCVAQQAIEKAGLEMTFEDVTIGLHGQVLRREQVAARPTGAAAQQ